MKGCYRAKKRKTYLFLSTIDFISRFLPSKQDTIQKVEKILIANQGHLGDVTAATAVINPIHERFPNAKINFLTNSSSAEVLENHPLISNIYCVDHWKLSRKKIPIWKKLKQYHTSFKRTLQQLKKDPHQIGIDLYSFYPNSAFFLWMAAIPMRIGFTSGGCASLYTHPIPWKDEGQNVFDDHNALLRSLGISKKTLSPYLPKRQNSYSFSYVVIHPGSGDVYKNWKEEKWKEVIQQLHCQNETIIITGIGKEEKKVAEKIAMPKTINLVDRLTISEFIQVIAHAKMVISVDSFAAHLAAAFDIKRYVLFSNVEKGKYWHKPSSTMYALDQNNVDLVALLTKEKKR